MVAFACSANAQSWLMQNVGFTYPSAYPFDIDAANANNVWTVGSPGDGSGVGLQEFSHTKDGGNLWTAGSVTLDTNFRFSNISAVSKPFWSMQNVGFSTVGSYPFDIDITSASNIWAAAYSGDGSGAGVQDFSRSNDGGATWSAGVVTADTNYRFSGLAAIDTMTCYAAMYNNTAQGTGSVFKTTDEGATWTVTGAGVMFTDPSSFPDVIHFWGANYGMALGDPVGGYFEIYLTTDSGTTWTRVPQVNIPNPLSGEYGIVNDYSVKDSVIWIGTNKGRIYKSTNGGLNWTVSAASNTTFTISNVAFRDTTTGLCIGSKTVGATTTYNLYRSVNGGTTWTLVNPTGSFFKSDIAYIPGTNMVVSCAASTSGRGSSVSTDDGASWAMIDTAGGATQNGYTSLAFLDENTGWAGGFTVDPTTDGIYKWNSGNACFAAMYNNTAQGTGSVFKTTDDGATWSALGAGTIYTDPSSWPDVVHFWDPNYGVVIGDPIGGYFEIYNTYDGGASWSRIPQINLTNPVSGEYGLTNVYAVKDSTIWFGTNKGRIYKSVNLGVNWTVATVSSTKSIDNITFRDANNGICTATTTAGVTSYYRTTNGGTSWTLLTPTGSYFTGDVVYVPGTTVLFSASASTTLGRGSAMSMDDGATWALIDTAGGGTTDGYTSLEFFNSQNGWAGGFTVDPLTDGIYKWNGGTVSIAEHAPLKINEVLAYPNPSNGLVSLKLNENVNGYCTVSVFDIMGKMVYNQPSYVSRAIPLTVDIRTLPAGVYTVKVQVDNNSLSTRIIRN